jgi:acetyl esterase/lipase
MDAQRALSITRAHAKAWRLNPEQIGLLGFSAGGEAAALAAVAVGMRAYAAIDETDDVSCAADFALLIYPGGLAEADGRLRPFYPVSKETPPMFFAHASDDRVTCLSSTALFTALKLAEVPADLHIFATGGHGYGLRPTEESITHWPALAEKWLKTLK